MPQTARSMGQEAKAVAADAGFRDDVLEALAPIGEVSSRSMFGGFGIFAAGDMFGLISGAALFFKVDDSNRGVYEEMGSKQYGSMPYYRVPNSVLEDQAKLVGLAQTSIALARAASTKKRR